MVTGEKCRGGREKRRGGPAMCRATPFLCAVGQAVKLLPHPHPPVAFGLLKVKPEPCIELT
jgi:hypothetical protein